MIKPAGNLRLWLAYSADIAEKHGGSAPGGGGFQYLYQPRYGCGVLVPLRRKHHHLRHAAH